MVNAAFIPAGIPAVLQNLIQSDKLSSIIYDTLTPYSAYRSDFEPMKLPPGVGSTLSFDRLSANAPDLLAAPATGNVDVMTFGSEKFTASPVPYAKKINIDAPTAYVQIGSRWEQSIQRLALWAALTSGRLARAELFRASLQGQAMVRRTQAITTDSVILVNSLAGFRYVQVNGVPTPVSATNMLPITIVAVTTFTALVTGTTPIDPNFPDGPGQLTLSTGLSAALVEGSYVYVTGARPYVVRPNARASSDALLATDLPLLANLRTMQAKLQDQGVQPHKETGTFHVHLGPGFFDLIQRDTAYGIATQGMGVSPQLGPGAFLSASLGMTFILNIDSPAVGKSESTLVKSVGASGYTVGATGTPGSSQTLIEIGCDAVNKAGVRIERIVMTGDEFGDEVYIDEMDYIASIGGQKIGEITKNISTYSVGNSQFMTANLMGWRMIVRPPMDDRMLISTVTLSNTFDFLMRTDVNCLADSSDLRPYKRSIVMEYGVPASLSERLAS